MPDSSAAAQATAPEVLENDDTVSTQSEYLREAVDDLLRKYDAAPKEE